MTLLQNNMLDAEQLADLDARVGVLRASLAALARMDSKQQPEQHHESPPPPPPPPLIQSAMVSRLRAQLRRQERLAVAAADEASSCRRAKVDLERCRRAFAAAAAETAALRRQCARLAGGRARTAVVAAGDEEQQPVEPALEAAAIVLPSLEEVEANTLLAQIERDIERDKTTQEDEEED
jgi:hypothetical protein